MAVDVVVEPATFTLVSYDAGEIATLVAEAASWVGVPDGTTVTVKVDESSPLSLTRIESFDPIVLFAEGGAFEDAKKIRTLDRSLVQIATARLLARVADRRRPGFEDAPDEASLTVQQIDAWDAWALGRGARRGMPVPQPRWRYRFRNHHGFTDVADAVFDRLWATDELTWADLEAACAETAAVRPEPPAESPREARAAKG